MREEQKGNHSHRYGMSSGGSRRNGSPRIDRSRNSGSSYRVPGSHRHSRNSGIGIAMGWQAEQDGYNVVIVALSFGLLIVALLVVVMMG